MSKPNFLQFMQEKDQLDEAFNSAPYELTMGKKNAGDVFFTFIDEDEKEYRIQFYTPQGLGKNVRQVFIGQKRGSVYPDAIARFKNPMRVIASMIEATKQFLATPLGKTIDGYAVNFSKKALDRGMTLIPKIIRQSGLKQKLNVMDLTYAPVPDRGYVWLVKKGKDPAQVFDGPKMKGITWDDPDKVGDVPDQAKADAALQGDIDDLSQTINTQKSGWYNEVAPAGNPSIGWYNAQGTYNGGIGLRFSAIYGVYSGSSAAVNFKEIEGKDVDALARKLKLPPIPKQVSSKFVASAEAWWKQKNIVPPKAVPANPANIIGSGTAVIDAKRIGSQEVEVERLKGGVSMRSRSGDVHITISDADFMAAARDMGATKATVVIKNGRFEGAINSERKGRQGDTWDILSAGGDMLLSVQLNNTTSTADSTDNATSVDELRKSGFFAKVFGIVDTRIDQALSYLPGERIRKIGVGRYSTAGGLIITVNFNGLRAGQLEYEVWSEISEQKSIASGDARAVADAVMASMSTVAMAQYAGEWEIRSVPMSAPYPINAIRRSKGWGYIETTGWTLKVAEALLNRVNLGDTAALDLIKEPLRGKHLLEIIPEKDDKTLMLKDRSGTIYGSIDLDGKGADAINSKTLRMPSNAEVFGETVNGMSISWKGINFPKTGKYADARLVMNVTYYYDKGKVAITPMVTQKGRILNNPRSYEVTMDKQVVQSSLDRWSEDMQIVGRNMQTLTSSSYNPEQVFLDDIVVDDHGGVKWRGYDMGDRRTTETMLKVISKETDRLEAEGAKPSAANDVAGKMTQERWELFLTEFESVPGLSKVNYGRDKAKALYVYGNSDYLDITMTRLSDKAEIYVDGKNSNGMLSSRWDSWNDGQYIAKTAKDVQAMLNQAIKKGETVMGGEPKQAPAAASLNGKTKETLAAYIESIRSSAPNTRDVTWQFLSRSNGQEVEIYWDLTFRRDTKTGAYGQYKSQIDLANRYVQSIVDDARQKGYNTSAPDLYTRDKAMADDRRAEEYGEGAYSEYEQAMSGGVTISILK